MLRIKRDKYLLISSSNCNPIIQQAFKHSKQNTTKQVHAVHMQYTCSTHAITQSCTHTCSTCAQWERERHTSPRNWLHLWRTVYQHDTSAKTHAHTHKYTSSVAMTTPCLHCDCRVTIKTMCCTYNTCTTTIPKSLTYSSPPPPPPPHLYSWGYFSCKTSSEWCLVWH